MVEVNNETKIVIPNLSSELAELIGIILGDGNIYSNKDHSSYELRIAGHSNDDQSYLIDYVSPMIHRLFGVKPISICIK